MSNCGWAFEFLRKSKMVGIYFILPIFLITNLSNANANARPPAKKPAATPAQYSSNHTDWDGIEGVTGWARYPEGEAPEGEAPEGEESGAVVPVPESPSVKLVEPAELPEEQTLRTPQEPTYSPAGGVEDLGVPINQNSSIQREVQNTDSSGVFSCNEDLVE